MDELKWFEFVNTGGTIAILVLNLYMFASGKVIPADTVSKMMRAADDRTLKMADEIKSGIANAVREGIVNGIHEVRNIQA